MPRRALKKGEPRYVDTKWRHIKLSMGDFGRFGELAELLEQCDGDPACLLPVIVRHWLNTPPEQRSAAVAEYLAWREAADDREQFDQAMAKLFPDGADAWLHEAAEK